MKRRFRYIAVRLAGPFAVVTACVTAVAWLTQSLRFIDLIVNHGLPIPTFFALTTLMLPSLLAIVMPAALFIAALHVYARMAADSELAALRATGSSNAALAAPAAALGALAAIAVLAINLWFMPASLRAFKDRQHELRQSLASTMLEEGVFDMANDGLTFYVRDRASDGALLGVLIHDSRDRSAPATTVIAERGAIAGTPGGPRFMLENGSRQQRDETGRVSYLHFERYAFDLAAAPAFPEGRFRKAGERYLGELLNPGAETGARERNEFLAEAYFRLTSPLHAVVLALIAAAAVLAGDFDRRGSLRRVLAGSCAGAAFIAGAFALRHAIAADPRIGPFYCLTVAVCGAAALFALSGRRRRRARPAAAGAG